MRLNSGNSNGRQGLLRRLIACLCVLVLAAGGLYVASWYVNRERVRRSSEHYSQLYRASASPAPEATRSASAAPSPEATPAPTDAPLPQALDVPLSTANAETKVFSLPTPPPVQESFSELLAVNPDTVGFLTIDGVVSLPVVQRQNDNEYYLTHDFSGGKHAEGALFLDGLNRLSPEDDCLIVYGHNMHNGSMFGNLRSFLNRGFFRSHALVSFDTLYENHAYVPFAAFNASMDASSRNAVDIRRFAMDETEFDDFVALLRARSEFSVDVDVEYGDTLLLLVTCDYSNSDGRFILALRRVRDGEDAEALRQKVRAAQ